MTPPLSKCHTPTVNPHAEELDDDYRSRILLGNRHWTQYHNRSPNRATFRAAVQSIAAMAHEKLPECNGRIN